VINSPPARGDLIRSGPAFFLIDHIGPEGSALGYRLVRQTQRRTRNEYRLPSVDSCALGLSMQAAWLVRLRLIRIPIEANHERLSCAPDELLAEILRRRTRAAQADVAEQAATPRIVCAAAAIVALFFLASCGDMGDLMSGEGHLHKAVRTLCLIHRSEIYAEHMTEAQFTTATALCRTYGFVFGQRD